MAKKRRASGNVTKKRDAAYVKRSRSGKFKKYLTGVPAALFGPQLPLPDPIADARKLFLKAARKSRRKRK